jgi:hypothetical protein
VRVLRRNHAPREVIADDLVIPDAIRDGVIERLATGFVHVNEHKAVSDDHLRWPSALFTVTEQFRDGMCGAHL